MSPLVSIVVGLNASGQALFDRLNPMTELSRLMKIGAKIVIAMTVGVALNLSNLLKKYFNPSFP
ncbi:MAG: hypothetical protein P1U70_25350 [Saprospiraceae bacterium]|nr:hypothetical protein [Saprospiraceae bacterium]